MRALFREKRAFVKSDCLAKQQLIVAVSAKADTRLRSVLRHIAQAA